MQRAQRKLFLLFHGKFLFGDAGHFIPHPPPLWLAGWTKLTSEYQQLPLHFATTLPLNWCLNIVQRKSSCWYMNRNFSFFCSDCSKSPINKLSYLHLGEDTCCYRGGQFSVLFPHCDFRWNEPTLFRQSCLRTGIGLLEKTSHLTVGKVLRRKEPNFLFFPFLYRYPTKRGKLHI